MNHHRRNEIIGFFAAILSTIAFIPQAVTLWFNRPKPAESVSLSTFEIQCTATVVWLCYGFFTKKPSIIGANGAGLLIASSILIYKLIYG